MSKVYYNQADSRWASHPYTAPGYPNATVKSAGCGPTCAAMVVSSSKEIIYPDRMCDISKENGFRPSGGTAWGLFQYVANRWGFETRSVRSSYEALQACKDGYFVVILCGAGLWTTGGHYILAVGANGDNIEIYDPYLYSGKFNQLGRQGKVNLQGNSAWVQIDTFKANSNAQAFFAYKMDSSAPQPTPSSDPKVKYVNTQTYPLNVRNAPNGAVVGSLAKGTQVLVYEENSGWSRIGDGKWVSSQYLSDSNPNAQPSVTYKYVNTASLPLNVRTAPNGSVKGQLAKGTKVTVVGEQNGWSHISSPVDGWVSSQYLGTSTSGGSSVNRGTVGQTKRFKGNTTIYSNSNLTGTKWNYLPNTSVKILANATGNADKVYVIQTGRTGYVNINSYK